MPILEFEVLIDAPPGTVFAYVSDLEKHVEWSGGQAIRRTSEGPIAPGSRYETEEAGPFGRTLREEVEVLQFEPNERFAWRSFGPLGSWFDWSFELVPRDGGTLLVERFDRSQGLLATFMLRVAVKGKMRKAMPDGLAKLKAKLEGA